MGSASVADILALRIRASLERGFTAQAAVEPLRRSAQSPPRVDMAQLASAAGLGWGTRPIRRRTTCRGAVARDSLGWGTRPI